MDAVTIRCIKRLAALLATRPMGSAPASSTLRMSSRPDRNWPMSLATLILAPDLHRLSSMNDDDAFDHRLLKLAQDYARLYPSVLPRLRSAYDAEHPAVRQAASAMTLALGRLEGQSERRLRDAYGLSPQETRVVLHLVAGGVVASCAEAMGVAESTVRSHLKSAFAKTGCRRQSQLAKLLR